MPTGDCFQVALDTALDMYSSGKVMDAVIEVVHGLPIGTGPDNRGKRYWHAWTEVDFDREGHAFTLVIDHSNDRDVNLPRDIFYGIGKLDEEHVYRYEVITARQMALETETYGPWISGWEEMSEV